MRSLVRRIGLGTLIGLACCGEPPSVEPAIVPPGAASTPEERVEPSVVRPAAAATDACDTPLACARIIAAFIKNPEQRASVLSRIGAAHAANGAGERALEIADGLRDHAHAHIELLVAIAASAPGGLDGARAREVLAIAVAAADAADRRPVPMTSESWPTMRERLARWIAERYLEHGRLAEAADMADGAAWRERVPLLLKIAARHETDAAARLAALDRAAGAIALDEPWACIAVAQGYFAARRPGQGYTLLRHAAAAARESADELISRDRACLGDVAAAYVAADHRSKTSHRRNGVGVRRATALARVREDDECASSLLEALATAGEDTALAAVLRERPDLRGPFASGLLALAARVRGQRQREAAHLAAFRRDLRREPEPRVAAWIALASLYRRSGFVAEARGLLDQAAPALRALDDRDARDLALRDLAEAEAEAGRCGRAVALARDQDDPSYTLAQIAEKCPDHAAIAVLLAARPLIRWSDRRSQFLAALVRRLGARGELRRALELVAEIEVPETRASALIDLHTPWARAKDPATASLLQRTIDSSNLDPD